jgi:hypothetical protein
MIYKRSGGDGEHMGKWIADAVEDPLYEFNSTDCTKRSLSHAEHLEGNYSWSFAGKLRPDNRITSSQMI